MGGRSDRHACGRHQLGLLAAERHVVRRLPDAVALAGALPVPDAVLRRREGSGRDFLPPPHALRIRPRAAVCDRRGHRLLRLLLVRRGSARQARAAPFRSQHQLRRPSLGDHLGAPVPHEEPPPREARPVRHHSGEPCVHGRGSDASRRGDARTLLREGGGRASAPLHLRRRDEGRDPRAHPSGRADGWRAGSVRRGDARYAQEPAGDGRPVRPGPLRIRAACSPERRRLPALSRHVRGDPTRQRLVDRPGVRHRAGLRHGPRPLAAHRAPGPVDGQSANALRESGDGTRTGGMREGLQGVHGCEPREVSA